MKTLTGCPVCNSQQISLAYSAPTTRGQDQQLWSVFECANCTHFFMNPQPSWMDLEKYYSEEYQAYDPMHGAQFDDQTEVDQATRTGTFRHIPVPAGKRVLDVGCGAGWFLRIAKKLGAIEQGVEPSGYAAKQAQNQGLSVFHGTLEGYAQQVPIDRKFDVITANHVIEHVPEPVETFGVMKTLLAPGGFIWIAVPNAGYMYCRTLKGRWHSSDLPYHLMQFTPPSMAKAGRRAGLKIRKQTTESIPENVAASMRLYLRYNWMLPRRLMEKIPIIDLLAKRYAPRFDAAVAGEAILTEFTSDQSQ